MPPKLDCLKPEFCISDDILSEKTVNNQYFLAAIQTLRQAPSCMGKTCKYYVVLGKELGRGLSTLATAPTAKSGFKPSS